MGRRVRTLVGVVALAEIVVFVAVASWIGAGWTILAALATTALGWVLLARQGTRALGELRERARTRQPAGRALGDAGLIALGGLLMVLPGFLGDLMGLLCLLPPTRPLVRALAGRTLATRLPDRLRGPVHVRSRRAEGVPPGGSGATRAPGVDPRVIEGEVLPPGERPAG